MFVTRKLIKRVATLTIAKVFQRDRRKIKAYHNQSQRHKKRVQPQLWEIERSSIKVNLLTNCENPTSFNQTDFLKFVICQN